MNLIKLNLMEIILYKYFYEIFLNSIIAILILFIFKIIYIKKLFHNIFSLVKKIYNKHFKLFCEIFHNFYYEKNNYDFSNVHFVVINKIININYILNFIIIK